MIYNKAFVDAVKERQEQRGDNQADFARFIGVSQGALSKFYNRGVRDGVVIKVLTKFPDLAQFFASENSN